MQNSVKAIWGVTGAAIVVATAAILLNVSSHKSFSVGTGSGNLVVDGGKIGANALDSIKIKGGKYSSIIIQNFNTSGGNVIIEDSGVVEISGNQNAMILSNLSNVVLTGSGPAGNNQGFSLHDNNYRPLQMQGVFHNFTIDHFLFKNTGDYVISSNFNTTVYKDSSTAWSDIHILNCEFNNTGNIQLDGDISNGQITGLIKRLEIAYCYFHDASPGDYVWAGAVEQYNVHHNILHNINATNNNHNGLFHLQGNGIFSYNKVKNHQGNLLRAWLVSFGTTVEQELIYNNIVDSSRKYSAFEVQGFQPLLVAGKTTTVNARVFGNTCGDLYLTNDKAFYGNVLDVYGLFGSTCEVFDNLAFNFPMSNPGDKIVNTQSSTNANEHNNLYTASYQLAGIKDTTSYKLVNTSPAIGKGLADILLPDDYYGNKRSNPPSIGGVEYGGVINIPPPVVVIPPPVVTPPPTPVSTIPVKTVTATITIYSDGTYKAN